MDLLLERVTHLKCEIPIKILRSDVVVVDDTCDALPAEWVFLKRPFSAWVHIIISILGESAHIAERVRKWKVRTSLANTSSQYETNLSFNSLTGINYQKSPLTSS